MANYLEEYMQDCLLAAEDGLEAYKVKRYKQSKEMAKIGTTVEYPAADGQQFIRGIFRCLPCRATASGDFYYTGQLACLLCGEIMERVQ